MNKKLMILGAGIYQVPLIRKAKEMGLETYVLSYPGNYPGIPLADHYAPLDTRDKEAICALAMKEGIHGICTSGTDVAVVSIGYVCDRMGLNGITGKAAELVTDKARMKDAFASHGVSTARYIRVHSLKEAQSAAAEIGYPIIIKPTDSSGSRGVRKVEEPSALAEAFAEAWRRTKKGYLLVEEFIDATEIGVDAFVGNGEFLAFFPHTKFTYTTHKGVTLPAGHQFPYNGKESLLAELQTQMLRAVRALGLSNCALNADVFVKNDKVWIIEIGGRTGATCIPELISIYQGYDWYEKLIRSALGEPVDFSSRTAVPCMSELIFSPIPGKITRIDEEALARLREKTEVQLDFPVGASIFGVSDATDRIGHVIAPTTDHAVLASYVREARRCIWLEEGNLQDLCEAMMHEIQY